MEVSKYKICEGAKCESYTAVAMDIQQKLDLDDVRIDPAIGELSYKNPRNCRVDEKLLEDAARAPGRNIEFQVCE